MIPSPILPSLGRCHLRCVAFPPLRSTVLEPNLQKGMTVIDNVTNNQKMKTLIPETFMIMTSLKITKMTEICCPSVHIVQQYSSTAAVQQSSTAHCTKFSHTTRSSAAAFETGGTVCRQRTPYSLEFAAAPIFSISSTLLVTNVGANIMPTSYHRGQNLYHFCKLPNSRHCLQ